MVIFASNQCLTVLKFGEIRILNKLTKHESFPESPAQIVLFVTIVIS